MNQSEEFLITCDDQLAVHFRRWQDYICHEKRLSDNTASAYQRDVRQFFQHLTGYLGAPPGLKDVAGLKPVDLRGFLANRRKGGAEARTLARSLSGIRSFIRYLERQNLADSAGLKATNAPKLPKKLPKPLAVAQAMAVTDKALQLD